MLLGRAASEMHRVISLFRIGTVLFCPAGLRRASHPGQSRRSAAPRRGTALELGQNSCCGSTARRGAQAVRGAHEDRFRQIRTVHLGLEWELALVDAASGELVSAADKVLAAVQQAHPELKPDDEHPHIKQELLLNTIELVTGVSHTVSEAKADLARTLGTVREATDPLGVELLCAGTHPFSHSRQQAVTDKERYAKLIERTQWWGSQMVIYGVHVHVGLDNVRKAMPVLDGLVNYVPHFQALSASSPFWNGEDTGYASQRALMFQQLPTAGLPFQFADWSGYEGYVQDMLTTGVIDDISEIRWDIRPVPALGTIEMRVCDGLSTLEEVGAIAASPSAWWTTSPARSTTAAPSPRCRPGMCRRTSGGRPLRAGRHHHSKRRGQRELVTEHCSSTPEPAGTGGRTSGLRAMNWRTWKTSSGGRRLPAAAARGGGQRRDLHAVVDDLGEASALRSGRGLDRHTGAYRWPNPGYTYG